MLRSSALGADIALDLGSARWRAALPKVGLVADAPAVVALDARGRNIAEGDDAKRMLGRAPAGVRIVRPIEAGRVADPSSAELMLRGWIDRALARSLRRPRALVAVPTDATSLELAAWSDLVLAAGAREVTLVARPVAAALGANLDISEPKGVCVLDIGAGRTEAAVLSMGSWVCTHSVPTGGNTLDEAVVSWLRRDAELGVGLPTAEEIKVGIGAALSTSVPRRMMVHGRDHLTHQVRELEVRTEQVVPWLSEPLHRVRECLMKVLAQTPPELASDLTTRGVTVVGGGARLRDLDRYLHAATELRVVVADTPGRCVIHGLHAMLTDEQQIDRVALS